MKLNSVIKVDTVNSFLNSIDAIEKGYTPFTLEFIEEYRWLDKETLPMFENALKNVLEIMDKTLIDFKFFIELRALLGD